MKVDAKYSQREEHDFHVEWFSGTGKGGQKRNKSQSCCRVYHLPTGLVESRQGRSRENNFNDAKSALIILLDDATNNEQHENKAAIRKGQVGSGMRGDKRRTYRFQDDQVADHENNSVGSVKQVMRGHHDILWK